jgi:hypothetical protein
MTGKTHEERQAEADKIKQTLKNLHLLDTQEARNKTDCCVSAFVTSGIKQTWFLSNTEHTYKITLRPEAGSKSNVIKMLDI